MGKIENVIIIVVDALRADKVGCINLSNQGLTPNIDAVAKKGTVFKNAYASSPNTDPSITSLLTGRYPLNAVYHHGKAVSDIEKRRVQSIKPLSSILSEKGWQTIAIGQPLGRWHKRGFDFYPEIKKENRSENKYNIYRKMKTHYPRLGNILRFLNNISGKKVSYTDFEDYYPNDLLKKMNHTPFFGFIHIMDTHLPYLAYDSDVDKLIRKHNYEDRSIDYYINIGNLTDFQYNRLKNHLKNYNIDNPDILEVFYEAAVINADRKIGALINKLKLEGYWDNTALFITSDHGESILEHEIYLDHHGLYDEVLHVPLVMNIPREQGGNQVSDFVQLFDIAPTILDLLNINGNTQMDGISLLPIVENEEEQIERDAVFAEEAYTQRRTTIRTEKWKYIKHVPDTVLEDMRGSSLVCGYCNKVHGGEKELYNLLSDPYEKNNIVDENPEMVSKLEKRYNKFIYSLIKPKSIKGKIKYENEDEILERLKKLGYQ